MDTDRLVSFEKTVYHVHGITKYLNAFISARDIILDTQGTHLVNVVCMGLPNGFEEVSIKIFPELVSNRVICGICSKPLVASSDFEVVLYWWYTAICHLD